MGSDERPKPHFTWSASGEGRYVRQFVGRGEYAHVRIRMSPSPPGSGLLLNNETTPGAIPNEFLPAVEEGLREAARRGIDGGFLVADIQIDLVDGSYHDIDSSVEAFRIAAAMAFRDAVNNAGAIPHASGDDHASGVPEPRHPRPAPRNSGVALPEPDEAIDTGH
jgi:translation elongation factor EF-G